MNDIALDEFAALLTDLDLDALESGLLQPGFKQANQLRSRQASRISCEAVLEMVGEGLQGYHVRHSPASKLDGLPYKLGVCLAKG